MYVKTVNFCVCFVIFVGCNVTGTISFKIKISGVMIRGRDPECRIHLSVVAEYGCNHTIRCSLYATYMMADCTCNTKCSLPFL